MSRDSSTKRRGNVLVEFALSLAIFFPLLAGTFQFGYSFYLYNKIQSAVRAGARYAALRDYDSSNATPSAAYATAVKNMVVFADPAGGTVPVATGLTTSHVNVSVTMGSGSTPSAVTVGVNGYQIQAIFGNITLQNKPSATFVYAGRYAGLPGV